MNDAREPQTPPAGICGTGPVPVTRIGWRNAELAAARRALEAAKDELAELERQARAEDGRG